MAIEKSALHQVYDALIKNAKAVSDTTNKLSNFGMESFDVNPESQSVEIQGDAELAGSVDNLLDNSMEVNVGTESAFGDNTQKVSLKGEFTKQQLLAGKYSLLFNSSPKQIKSGFESLSKDEVPSNAKRLWARGGESYSFATKNISSEAFDGSDARNLVLFNVIVNMGAARSEDFVEAFCPTIVLKPFEVGLTTTVEYPEYISNYFRDKSKAVLAEKLANAKPMIKSIFDKEIMTQQRTKIVPIKDTSDAATQWLTKFSYSTSVTGKKITAGFYKPDISIDIINLSQTEKDVANGGTNHTDNVLPEASLEDLVIGFKTDSGEKFIKLRAKGLGGAIFMPAQVGNMNDLVLRFKDQVFSIVVGETKCLDGNVYNPSELQSNSGARIYFTMDLSGDMNTVSGTTSVTAKPGKIVKIVKNGVELDLATDGRAIVDAVKGITLAGYSLDAYKANTNIREAGQLIRNNGSLLHYGLRWKSPASCEGGIAEYTGESSDFRHVNSLITHLTNAANYEGVSSIVSYYTELLPTMAGSSRGVFKSYTNDFSLNGSLVESYFASDSMSLIEMVDSLESKDRCVCIREAMRSKISQDAMVMLLESNYANAFENVYGGTNKKPTILIGCDPYIKYYLCYGEKSNKFSLTDEYEVVVVATRNPLMKGKMIMTLSTTDTIGSIDSIQKLGTGFKLMSPAATLNFDMMSVDGTQLKRATAIPRYDYFHTLEIAHIYKVSGIEEVLKKLAINVKQK